MSLDETNYESNFVPFLSWFRNCIVGPHCKGTNAAFFPTLTYSVLMPAFSLSDPIEYTPS